MSVAWALALVALLLAAWMLNLLGLPGNWVMCLLIAAYAAWAPVAPPATMGWPVVGGAFALALCGEAVEFAAGAMGAGRAGGSRRAAGLAILGSLLGGLVGLVAGIPVPLVGPILGALLFGGLGALAGAMIGERWKGRTYEHSWRVGVGAFWGRTLGTLGKALFGFVILILIVFALVF